MRARYRPMVVLGATLSLWASLCTGLVACHAESRARLAKGDDAGSIDGPTLPPFPDLPQVLDEERDRVLGEEGLRAPSVTLAVGDPVPTLAVAGWFGTDTPALTPGKVLVVEMWATWCRPCVEAMPHLSDLAERLSSKGLSVIGVNLEEAAVAEVQAFIARQGRAIRYANAFARDGVIQRDWLDASGIAGLPATFVVGRHGRLAWVGRPEGVATVARAVLAGAWNFKEQRQKAGRRRLVEPVARRAVELLQSAPSRGYRLLRILMGRVAFDDPEVLKQVGYHLLASPAVAERRLEVAAAAVAGAGRLKRWGDPEELSLMAQIRSAQGRPEEAERWRRKARLLRVAR